MLRSRTLLAATTAAVLALIAGSVLAARAQTSGAPSDSAAEAAAAHIHEDLAVIEANINSRKPTTTTAPPATTTTAAPATTTTVPPTTTVAPTTTSTAPPATTTTAPATTTTTTVGPPPPAGCGMTSPAFCEEFGTAGGLARFDFQLHTDPNEGVADTFQGEHDHQCHGPDTYRTVAGGQTVPGFIDVSGSELIWHCAPTGDPASGHLMTAVDTAGIATLSFSPKTPLTNVRKVCWDQNMNNLGTGKWVNMFVVQNAHVLANGGDLNYAAGLELPFGGVPLMPPPGSFNFTHFRGSAHAYNVNADGSQTKIFDQWGAFDANMETSPAPRHPICVEDLENGTLRYSIYQPAEGAVQTYTGPGALPNGEVRVILQDASYNPTKHDGSADRLTWHWDRIGILAG